MGRGSGSRLWWYASFSVGLILLGLGLAWIVGMGSDAVGIAGLVLSVVPLAVSSWGLVRQKARPHVPDSEQLDRAENNLARMVCRQWLGEVSALRLYLPEPIPTRWRLTEHVIGDLPFNVVRNRRLRFDGSADKVADLAAKFLKLNRRRLVIIGEPGTGKTTLAILLLLEIHNVRKTDPLIPTPVMFSLASFNPAEDLGSWLARQLNDDYPALRNPNYGSDAPSALVRERLILPVLDGLDEVAEADRPAVIARLNQELADGKMAFILTCRTNAYVDAVDSRDVLRGAAVIEAEPLDRADARAYLTSCIPELRRELWKPVLACLRPNSRRPLASALNTPLMLWLLSRTYLDTGRDPEELADEELFPNRQSIESHLFSNLIPSLIETHPPDRHIPSRPRRKWDVRRAQSGLGFLALHLNNLQKRDLAWWLLPDDIFGQVAMRRSPRFVDINFRERSRELLPALVIWLPLGLLVGLFGVISTAVGHIFHPEFVHPVRIQNLFGVLIWCAAALAAGFIRWASQPAMSSPASTPTTTLSGDRRLFIFRYTTAGIVLVAATRHVTGPGIWGLVLCLVMSVIFAPILASVFPGKGAWPLYMFAQSSLLRVAPLPLMSFLRDAHRLGILRQVGPVYQFRHIDLQDHLAKMYATSPGAKLPVHRSDH
jgi:hypothetical protein